MSKRKKSQQALRSEIAMLKGKRRNGLLIAITAFVGLAAIISVKVTLASSGTEWVNTPAANMALFMLAIVATGVAGWGPRAWHKAKLKMEDLQKKLK